VVKPYCPSSKAHLSADQTIRRRLERFYLVVLPPDELDHFTSPGFRDRLVSIEDNTDVVVDLRRLAFCDSAGVRALAQGERHLAACDSTLTLNCPPPIFDRILGVCGLDEHFVVRRPGNRRARRLGGADPARR
jgi:anti-anti-sigma factor